MIRFRNVLPLVVAALVGTAILGNPGQAKAVFMLRISDGTHTVTVTDNLAGDTDSTTGSIVVTTAFLTSGGITGWSQINVSTALSNFGSTDPFAQLEIGTLAKSNSSGPLTTLTIDVTQTGFITPASAPNFVMSSFAVASTEPGIETIQGFYDPTNSGNNAFSMPGTAQTPKQTVTNGVAPSNPSQVLISPGVSPFALDYHITIQPTANSQTFSTDNELTLSVPAPAGILLFASSVPLFVIGYVRKRFLKAPAA